MVIDNNANTMEIKHLRILYPAEQEVFKLALEHLAVANDKTYSSAAQSALNQKMYERLIFAEPIDTQKS